MFDMSLHGYDLSAKEEFVVETDNVDSMNITISSSYVVWKNMFDMSLHGYDLSAREGFVISANDVDSMSIASSGNFVVWRGMPAATGLWGYNLSTKESFLISPNDAYSVKLSPGSNYVVWVNMFDMSLHGYDLSVKEGFVVKTNDVDSMSVAIGGDFVVWRDMLNMDFYGAQIYRIINDECMDAVKLVQQVTYSNTTVGATGTDISSCGYNDTFDVWHTYTPNAGGQVTISTDGSTFDTTLAVFNACGGEEVACNDDYCIDNTQSRIHLSVVKGKTYFIRVAGFNGQTGDYQLLVTRGACTGPVEGDLNNDCKVDLEDFTRMAANWLNCNLEPKSACWE
jgi:hypothetical protein